MNSKQIGTIVYNREEKIGPLKFKLDSEEAESAVWYKCLGVNGLQMEEQTWRKTMYARVNRIPTFVSRSEVWVLNARETKLEVFKKI